MDNVLPTRILYLEDQEDDFLIVKRVLEKSSLSFELRRVEKLDDFRSQLRSYKPDVILCDHLHPGFDSSDALQVLRRSRKRIPFLLLTSIISEQFAVTMLKEGIDDYILKDRLGRLPAAISSVLNKSRAELESQRSRKESRDVKRTFKALIENISDGIITFDKKGVILFASPSARKMTGHSNAQLEGHSFFSVLKPSDCTFLSDFRNGMLDARKPANYTFSFEHANGQILHAEGTVKNMLHDDTINAYILNFRDISGRQKAEQQLRKSEANLRTIFDNTEISYVFMDKHFNVLSFNHEAQTRYRRDMKVKLKEGANLVELTAAHRKEEVSAKFRQAISGERVNYETITTDVEGNQKWYNVNILPVMDVDGNPLGIILSSEEITARKLADIERDTMTAEIIRHNKNLEQFSYIVSHNLRAPVANIMGLSKLIEDRKMSPEDLSKCIAGLVSSVQKLDDVIIDLNHILHTRNSADEKKEMIDLPALLADIRSSISGTVKDKIAIATDFEVREIYTVRSYLHSIFLNLITNSVKYRNPAVDSSLKISTIREKGQFILIFKDNGLGLDLKSHKDKLFGLYKKFHAAKEGKGMGLYMVKTQVEILGGRITVDGKVNKGLTFRIEFDESSVLQKP